ncbi:MAG: hypothetical protein E7656_05290 [Ruminococcaceae bacterium]|nr:hypothetical protein [Oscillospiraceae bacterium]
MTLQTLCEKLGLEKIIFDHDTEISGVYVGDFLSRAMSRVGADNVWVTIMANTNVVAVASLTDAACILLAEGVQLPEEALSAARENSINVLSSDDSAYDLCLALSAALNGGEQ